MIKEKIIIYEQRNRFVFNCFAIIMLIISINVTRNCFAVDLEEDDVYTSERLDELENKYGKTTQELFGLERSDIKAVVTYSLAKDKGLMGGNEYFEVRTKNGKTKIFSMGRGTWKPVPKQIDSASVDARSKMGLDKRRKILNKKLAAKNTAGGQRFKKSKNTKKKIKKKDNQ